MSLVPGRRGRFEVRTSLRSLTPGFHGMHIHEAGVCQVDAKDPACATAPPSRAPRPTRLSVSDILDADGSAVIVHLAADNVTNIPIRYHAQTPDKTSTTFGPDTATLATGDAGGRAAAAS